MVDRRQLFDYCYEQAVHLSVWDKSRLRQRGAIETYCGYSSRIGKYGVKISIDNFAHNFSKKGLQFDRPKLATRIPAKRWQIEQKFALHYCKVTCGNTIDAAFGTDVETYLLLIELPQLRP